MEQNTSDYMDNIERYINPYTDFDFKKLFGTEMKESRKER